MLTAIHPHHRQMIEQDAADRIGSTRNLQAYYKRSMNINIQEHVYSFVADGEDEDVEVPAVEDMRHPEGLVPMG